MTGTHITFPLTISIPSWAFFTHGGSNDSKRTGQGNDTLTGTCHPNANGTEGVRMTGTYITFPLTISIPSWALFTNGGSNDSKRTGRMRSNIRPALATQTHGGR